MAWADTFHPGWGLCTPWQIGSPAAALSILRPGWHYNYLYDRIGEPDYMPMLWRLAPEHVEDIVIRLAPDQFALAGNEPELAGQSNTTPAQAAQAALQWHAVHKRWGGPGIYAGDPDRWPGLAWLAEWIQAMGIQPPVLTVHIYAEPDQWRGDLERLLAFCDRHGITSPILITETAGWDDRRRSNEETQAKVMRQATAAMRELPQVRGVAWYSARDPWIPTSWLLNEADEVTAVGRTWLAETAEHRLYLPAVWG